MNNFVPNNKVEIFVSNTLILFDLAKLGVFFLLNHII